MSDEIEDQVVESHTRIARGLSMTGMRMLEMMQRRREEAARREADGQREAAQALRDRETARRDAARTIAAQGLDPRWREAASDREIATAFVYAEAYREIDPLARVAHEQMSEHITARHGEIAAFIDGQVTATDLDHVPAPEGAPTPTQQRWIDAARAAETVEAHGEVASAAAASKDPKAEALPPVLDAEQLRAESDRTIASLLEDTPDTPQAVFVVHEQDAAHGATILDPEAVRRLADADATIADLTGESAEKVVIVPDLSEYAANTQRKALLAAANDETAGQWADLAENFGREHADQWLSGNLADADMANANKWLLWQQAHARIEEGESIQETMRDLAEKEASLGLDLDHNGTVGETDASRGETLVDDATAQLRREGMTLGDFPHDRDSLNALESRDPQAAGVLRASMPGRTRGAADQLQKGSEHNLPAGKKAHTRGQQRQGERATERGR